MEMFFQLNQKKKTRNKKRIRLCFYARRLLPRRTNTLAPQNPIAADEMMGRVGGPDLLGRESGGAMLG